MSYGRPGITKDNYRDGGDRGRGGYNNYQNNRGDRGGFDRGGRGRGDFGNRMPRDTGDTMQPRPPLDRLDPSGVQNTSWNGFPIINKSDGVPSYFSQFFRARPPLEYVQPTDGIAPKNYRIKGYQPLVDEHHNVLERFEEQDQLNTKMSKAQ